jgi:hypothetical protein
MLPDFVVAIFRFLGYFEDMTIFAPESPVRLYESKRTAYRALLENHKEVL